VDPAVFMVGWLALVVLAVLVDWAGKPMRGRFHARKVPARRPAARRPGEPPRGEVLAPGSRARQHAGHGTRGTPPDRAAVRSAGTDRS
jgi:hypothetical protein